MDGSSGDTASHSIEYHWAEPAGKSALTEYRWAPPAGKVAIPPLEYLGEYPAISGAVPKALSTHWSVGLLEATTGAVQPDTKTNKFLLPCGLPAPEGDMGTTRYATMDLPRLARPEGCCDMTVYLCEDYGLG